MAYARNLKEARERAQANADYFGVPFYVFTNTSGNYHVDRHRPSQMDNVETFLPKKKGGEPCTKSS
jgi:hypothetical protein